MKTDEELVWMRHFDGWWPFAPPLDDSDFASALEEWEYEAALLGTTIDGLHTTWALGADDVSNKTLEEV